MEKLGIESVNILLDDNNDLCYYGSRRGIECMSQSKNIDSEFRKYFGKFDETKCNCFSKSVNNKIDLKINLLIAVLNCLI